MEEPIEIAYFNWLCAKVLENNNNDYASLMWILYNTEFVWVVPADKHRVSDGLELREDFLREQGLSLSSIVSSAPCSVLELFISFSSRASFQTDIPDKEWFWTFIENLSLDSYHEVLPGDVTLINDILYTFIWRIYEPSGEGGMFPMHQTQNDQREIEIWYQFNEYLDDRGLF